MEGSLKTEYSDTNRIRGTTQRPLADSSIYSQPQLRVVSF